MMERLTEKQSSGFDLKAMNGEWCNKYCEKQRVQTCNECVIYQAVQKLAEYENLEELIGIPLKEIAEIFRQNIPEDCKHPRKAIVLTDDDVDRWHGYRDGRIIMKDKQLLKKAYTTPKKFAECIDTIFSNNVDKIAHYFGVKADRDNISVDMLMEWLIEEGVSYADFVGFFDSFYEDLRTDE